MIDLGKDELALLMHLVQNGPDIGNHMRPDVKNASRAGQRLKDIGLITGRYTDEFSRGGGEVFSLTVYGIGLAIYELKTTIDVYYPRIIKRWSARLLPLVLGKWSHFKREGIERGALLNLSSASNSIYHDLASGTVSYNGYPNPVDVVLSDPQRQEHQFTRYFYDFYMTENDADAERWFKVCSKDNDINSLLKEIIRDTLKRNKEQNITLQRHLKRLV